MERYCGIRLLTYTAAANSARFTFPFPSKKFKIITTPRLDFSVSKILFFSIHIYRFNRQVSALLWFDSGSHHVVLEALKIGRLLLNLLSMRL